MPKSLSHGFRWTLLIAAGCWLVAIAWLSLSPSPPVPPEFLSWDKLQHAGAYALLTLLAGPWLETILSRRVAWLAVAGFGIGYGALMEVLQGLGSAGRFADPLDALANACGAILAAWLGCRVSHRVDRRRKS